MPARTCRRLVALAFVALCLAACGNKGPLVKPPPTTPAAPAGAAPAHG